MLRLIPEKESSRAPWLPSMSKGAKMMTEHFLCALAQEAAYKGHAFRKGSGDAKRLSAKHIKAGWDSTFDSVFATSCMMPQVVAALPLARTKIKKSEVAKKNKMVAEDDDEQLEPGHSNELGTIEAITEGD